MLQYRIYTYILCCIWGVYVFPSFSTTCNLRDCDSINKYRTAQASLQTPLGLACSKEEESQTHQQLKTLMEVLNPNQNKLHNQFSQCVQDTLVEVQKRRENDKNAILQQINDLELSKISKEEQLEMLRSLLGEDSFYSYFYEQYQLGGNRLNTLFTFTGPAVEMSTALEGGIEQDGVFKQVYTQSGWDVLNQQENPVQFLVEQMKVNNYHIFPSPQDQNFTPGMSKLILFELIRSVHHRNTLNSENYMEDFNQFAKTIQLGVVIPDSDFYSNKDYKTNKARFKYTINDGYFLSATVSHMNPGSLSLPMSFDCISFIQKCAFGIDSYLEEPSLKLVTRDFIRAYQVRNNIHPLPSHRRMRQSVNKINETFDMEPLHCETQLSKGDMVVFPGHIFIFNGYQKHESGQFKMQTIEASGNQNRALGLFERDVYDPSCRQFIWGRDDALPGGRIRNAFIVRFKNQS